MLRWCWLGLVAVVGCYSPAPHPGIPCANGACPTGLVCASSTETCEYPGSDAPGTGHDAARGDAWDAPPGVTCYGTGLVTVCPLAPVTMPLLVSAVTLINTDSSAACVPYSGPQPGLCVVAATSIDISSGLAAIGSRPLVLVATDAISVTGAISVASHVGTIIAGAGADPGACIAGASAATGDGGPGGSFGTRGGAGGATLGTIAAGDPAGAVASLRGGCRGGDGGGANGGGLGVPGGHGGGAVYLIARASIRIDGVIAASGAGGGTMENPMAGGGAGVIKVFPSQQLVGSVSPAPS